VSVSEITHDEAALTIGQLAGRFDLPTHVLRHWEDVGLIEPAERVSGRRRYHEWQAGRIAMILRGKDAGLSLEQLREILEAPDGPSRKGLLRRHRQQLEQRRAAIELSKAMIEHAIDCQAEDFTRCPHFLRILQRYSGPSPPPAP
jgi:MerR family transcriptional regulator, copper efflux regulator